MATTTRTQRAYQSVTDDGTLRVHIYGLARDEDGKQAVVKTLSFDSHSVAEKLHGVILAKGLGFYMAGRYASVDADDLTPEDIEDACEELYDEMVKGTFAPGRASGPARPTPFFEALAEHLHMPVHFVMEKVRSDKTTFSAGQLAKMAKFPAVAVITARIERERALDKEKRAKAAAKTADDMDIAGLFDFGPAEASAETTAAD
jgi:hypothetical protein